MMSTQPQVEAAASLALDAPVVAVTLFEDRAQVTRRGALELKPGVHRLRVLGVTPLVADRTLTARMPPELRLDEVRVRRRWRIGAEEQPAPAADLTQERRRLTRALGEGRARLSGLETSRSLLQQAAQLYVDSVNREMPFATGFEGRWEQELEALFAQLRAQDQQWGARQDELRGLERALEALTLRQVETRRPDHVLAAELWIDLSAAEAGRFEIELDYTVACALWRPIHRATLRDGQLHFAAEAAVWQATGEDWRDAALSFSTARSTQRAEPPLLADDLLRVRARRDKKVQVQVRETAIATTGEGVGAPDQGLPGVDDGGETRLLEAPARADVLADGRMRRVPIFAFEAEAEVDRICCPELAPLVHLRSRQTNAGLHPLLAGPVDLVRDSGYVGRGELGFVAPGERFALGWGSEDGLRVRREAHEQRDTARITGKQIITRRVELALSNLDDAPARFTVQERVPVSEIDKVKIEVDHRETTPLQKPDAQGLITWPVELPARGSQEIKLVYSVIASSEVQGL